MQSVITAISPDGITEKPEKLAEKLAEKLDFKLALGLKIVLFFGLA